VATQAASKTTPQKVPGSPTSKAKSSSKTITKSASTKVNAISKAATNKTTPKAKTVSTTSKAYKLLVDEHRVYKSYIDFLHDYLQKHLFTQYKTLKIPTVESLLKKSLQAIKKQDYTYTIMT
jgi:predicted ribosome quality control (RQC) complex YloA/Tae2 family protein